MTDPYRKPDATIFEPVTVASKPVSKRRIAVAALTLVAQSPIACGLLHDVCTPAHVGLFVGAGILSVAVLIAGVSMLVAIGEGKL